MQRIVALCLCALALAPAGLAAQDRQVIRQDTVPGLPFSPGIRTGNLIFLSGQIGSLPGTRTVVPGGIAAETRQSLENIRHVLQAAGSSMSRVVKCTVFLADIGEYAAMNEVYRSFFTSDPPARSTVAVANLVFGARVEIECIALAGP